MDQATTVAFLEALDVSNIAVSGEWVRGSCPLAPWSHNKGTDSRPSFGVRITPPEQEGQWHCFSCSSGGTLGQLLNSLTWAQGAPPPKEAKAIYLAADLLIEEGESSKSITISDRFNYVKVQAIAPKPVVPSPVLRQFPPLTFRGSKGAQIAYEWLIHARNIDPVVIEEYGLRLQRNPLGVIFPVCNRKGEVIDLWVRLLVTKKFYRLTPQITGSKVPYKAREEWFGWQFYKPGQIVTVVEGALDCLRLRSLGTKNVLASLGPPTGGKWAAIYSPTVVLAFDSDDSGKRYKRYAKAHLNQCTLWDLDWGVVHRKDPGELKSKSELVKVLSKKVELQHRRI